MSCADAKVAVIMGSKSDLGTLEGCFKILDDFGISYVKRVMSAHRTPAEAAEFSATAAGNGFKVIICAAGMAAHLAGAIAANTVLPVIGIPVSCEPFNGFDALFSTVQMPPGIPVATVTVGKAGAKNAALLAIEMMALADPSLTEKLLAFRKEQSEAVRKADSEL